MAQVGWHHLYKEEGATEDGRWSMTLEGMCQTLDVAMQDNTIHTGDVLDTQTPLSLLHFVVWHKNDTHLM